jgi:hypothetical protein
MEARPREWRGGEIMRGRRCPYTPCFLQRVQKVMIRQGFPKTQVQKSV